MPTQMRFQDIEASSLHDLVAKRKEDGWRYVQTCCTNTEDGVDYTITLFKDGLLDNFQIRGIKSGQTIQSISDLYFSAFVFENESHDLFGVDIEGIVIDFEGHFYDLTVSEPMTIISPEQKAARDKQKKIAAAKAAKAAKAKADKSEAASSEDEAKKAAEFEAKLAAMDPEKAAKVRAALEAKKAAKAAKAKAAQSASSEDEAKKEAELEAKLAAMDPEKAAKVRAAMKAKKAREAAQGKEA